MKIVTLIHQNEDSQVGEIVATNIHSYERGDIYLVAMDAVVLSGLPVLTAHDKMEWITAASLLEYQLAPADIPIAEKLMQL